MLRSSHWVIFAAVISLLAQAVPASADPGVVVSVKPIHSLVAGVMNGVGEPHLIVKGSGSPHTYALKPSDAAALQRAKAAFWAGATLERFLVGPIKSLAKQAAVVALAEAPGLTMLKYREGGPWSEHDADPGYDKHREGEKIRGDVDMHFWLDPANARVLVHEIVEALAKADPANADAYEDNGKKVTARLDSLSAALMTRLEPVKDKPFVVFHDAYQYLEKRFGLNAVGSVTVSPDVRPGARRLTEIRAKIRALGAVCVFAEPQFEPKLVRVVTEGTKARTGVLDPIGADLADGPDLYFDLMERNAEALRDCLSKTSRRAKSTGRRRCRLQAEPWVGPPMI